MQLLGWLTVLADKTKAEQKNKQQKQWTLDRPETKAAVWYTIPTKWDSKQLHAI